MSISHDVIAIVILILDIWAIMGVLSSAIDPIKKVFWCLLIIILPIVGPLLWIFLGSTSSRSLR
jgi:hypothetical protein